MIYGYHSHHSIKLPQKSHNHIQTTPQKKVFSAIFTNGSRYFDIESPKHTSMRQDIHDTVMKRTELRMLDDEKVYVDSNPMYEDPRDVIGEKPPKPPRKRNVQGIAVSSPRKEGKSLLKEQKRKLTKKYESLITTLMDKCEENMILISEKDAYISKLREKLKSVLEYNKLFADENDQLKSQYTTLVDYIEECKKVIREERDRNSELEARRKELEDRVKQLDVPDRDTSPKPIPLVEVCMSCSSRQIVLTQARDQNTRLQRDMQALKDVLYRLNVQLSRYQEKLRTNAAVDKDAFRPSDRCDVFDSLVATSLGYKTEAGNTEEDGVKNPEDQVNPRLVDISGLLSAQALAPLFDAYQENIQEKDILIADYEKQFENINKKSKQIVTENKALSDKVRAMDHELVEVRQSYKKLVLEKETADIEKATLVERVDRAESKLKEVYELYEDKIAAMTRDYETIHREYFTTRSALEASEGRHRTVSTEAHERRLQHCKRLLDDLKHQYTMENDRKTEQITKLQENLRILEEKYKAICADHEALKIELKTALKNVKLYRKAAVVFRRRFSRARRRHRAPLRQAMETLDAIKREIKVVKSRAHSSLEELERRIIEQERGAERCEAECKRELDRAANALQRQQEIVKALLAQVREGSRSTNQRQPVETSTSSVSKMEGNVKMVPGPGGYFQDKGKGKTK